MKTMTFSSAIEAALLQAMEQDERIVVFGEDVQTIRRNLFVRFGGDRVLAAPISEAAFVGAAVSAAMAGLRPVVEVMLVDFVGTAMDALLNHAAKVERFSGGSWKAPFVVRSACGGGYGDGGQHEQSLWGWLAHIPGLTVVVPSTPSDAAGLMLAALAHDGPVVYLEHKLLADYWLDYMGRGGRKTVTFDVPQNGAQGPVPHPLEPTPIGKAAVRREGKDIALISVGVGVHRALSAAGMLDGQGISSTVIDLRTVSPLDKAAVRRAAQTTGRIVVVDEDYRDFGLSGEIAAVLMEAGITARYARVCVDDTIPYDRYREEDTLPNVRRIVETVKKLAAA